MRTTATVSVVVQVWADGTWPETASVGQVRKMASEEAINKVRDALQRAGIRDADVKDARVTLFTTEEA